jgi:hypothetical protein
MMIAYNELSRATDNEIIGDDNLFIVENVDPQEKVDNDKEVGDGVKIEDESLGLDDCSNGLVAN